MEFIMDIQKNKSFKPVGIALLAGSLATGIQASLLPSEAKIAIKNTIFGQDYYVRRAKEAADETMLFSGRPVLWPCLPVFTSHTAQTEYSSGASL